MKKSRLPGWCVALVVLGLPLTAGATIVYTYDFPGTPGSGVAVDQTNSQPSLATFNDWSRSNITALPTSGVFDSGDWNTSSFFDPTTYASFSITATAGYHMNLSEITFDEMRASGGPTKGRVVIFLNGSTTAFATFNYNPTASVQNKLFDFTDTTDADNVTTVEFRFYGWNGGTTSAGLLFDNVATTLEIVPEAGTWLAALLPLAIVSMKLISDVPAQRRRTNDRRICGKEAL